MDEEVDVMDKAVDVCICCLNKGPVRSMSERANIGQLYTQSMLLCFGLDDKVSAQVTKTNIGDRRLMICGACERQLLDSLHFRHQVERSLCILEELAKATGLNENLDELTIEINEEDSIIPEDSSELDEMTTKINEDESIIPEDSSEADVVTIKINEEEYIILEDSFEVDEVTTKIKEEESIIPEDSSKMDELTRKINEDRSIIPVYSSEVDVVTIKINEEEYIILENSSEVDELTTKIKEEESIIPDDSSEMDELTTKINEDESIIPEYSSEMNELTTKINDDESIIPEYTSEVDVVTTKINEDKSIIPEYSSEMDVETIKINEEEYIILENSSEVDELTTKIKEEESIIPEDSSEMDELTTKINEDESIIPEYSSEMDELTTKINDDESIIPEYTSEVDVVTTKINEDGSIIPEYSSEMDEMTTKINEDESIICEDSSEVNELTIKIKQEESIIPEDSSKVDESTTKIKQEESVIPEDNSEKEEIVNSNQNDHEEYYLVTFDSDVDVDIQEYVLLPNDCDWKRQNMLTLLEYSKIYPFHYDSSKYKCFCCGHEFLEVSQIRSHTKEHSVAEQKNMIIEFLLSKERDCYIKVDVRNLECRLCRDNLPNLQSLKVHLKDVHSKDIDPTYQDSIVPFKLSGEAYDCQLCEKTFDEMIGLVHHMHVHFCNYTCEICGAPFITEISLRAHNKTHETHRFQCDQCYIIFPTSKKYYSHLNAVHNKHVNIKCLKRPEHLKSTHDLMKHVDTVHNDPSGTYKCDICAKEFALQSMLDLHIKQVHILGVMYYRCTRCASKFVSAFTLERHIVSSHADRTDLKCEVCQKPYLLRSKLLEHMRTHKTNELTMKEKYNPLTTDNDVDWQDRIMAYKNDWKYKNILTLLKYSEIYPFHYQSRKYQCFICRCTFLDVSELRNHTSAAGHSIIRLPESFVDFLLTNERDCYIKVDVSNLECRLCKYNLPNLQSLKVHLKDVHSKDIDPTYQDSIVPFKLSGEAYDCQLCEQTFDEMIVLIRHTHFHFCKYTCEICGAPFTTELSLRAHNTTHETLKFQCDQCYVIFPTSKKCCIHVNTVHNKSVNMECPENLKNTHDLMKHVEAVHNNQPSTYKCDICTKEFAFQSILDLHVKQVHILSGHMYYKCARCAAKFVSALALGRHMISSHPHQTDLKCETDTTGLSLQAHNTTHETLRFQCDQCYMIFPTSKKYYSHINAVHNKHVNIKYLKLPEHLKSTQDLMKHVEAVHNNQPSTYKCDICTKEFAFQSILDLHVKQVHILSGHKYYKCARCAAKFVSALALGRHMISSHAHRTDLKCETDTTGLSLQAHNTTHETLRFQCDQCYMIFPTSKKCYSHINAVHNKHVNIKCLKLPEHLKSTQDLMKHVEAVHNNQPSTYKCDICAKEFAFQSILDLHIKQVHILSGDMSYKCARCAAKFVSALALGRHMVSSHAHQTDLKCETETTGLSLRDQSTTHKTSRFQCNLCDRTYASAKNRRVHINAVHYGVRRDRKCPKCPERFKGEYDFRKHLVSVHMEARRIYECDICNKELSCRGALYTHVKLVHENIKNYKCPECPAKFCLVYNLKKHMIRHTGEKNFECDICQKAFALRNSLKSHIITHTRSKYDRNFICEVCGKAFFDRSGLGRHLKNVHGLHIIPA